MRFGRCLVAGKTPVASINLCFSCGDILVWPPYSPSPKWDAKKQKMMRKLLKAYDRAFPQWERFFTDTVGLPTDWKQIPRRDSATITGSVAPS